MFSMERDPKLRIEYAFKEGREEGLQQGYEHGFRQGLEQGRDQIFRLYQKLLEENRLEDWDKALSDETYRDDLLQERNGL